MIEEMDRGSGAVLGFSVSGDVTRADYDTLTPAVAAAIEEHGSVRLLLDLTGFYWEKVGAWGADLHFGREFPRQDRETRDRRRPEVAEAPGEAV